MHVLLRSIPQDRVLFDYNCGSARYNEPLISSVPLLVTDALVEILPVLLAKYMVVVLTHAVQPHLTRWTIHRRICEDTVRVHPQIHRRTRGHCWTDRSKPLEKFSLEKIGLRASSWE